MFRKTTVTEQILFNLAPAWTEKWTKGCKHKEVHVDESDGTIECSTCGLCLPEDGKW